MFKRLIAILLIMLLSITSVSCGSGGTKSTSDTEKTVSYDEKEIGSNAKLYSPGNARINSKDQLVICDFADGKTLEYVTLDADGNRIGDIKPAIEGDGSTFTIDQQDELYILTKNMKAGQLSQKLYKVSSKGQILNAIELKSADQSGYNDIAVDSKGNIYLATLQKGIDVFDGSGKKLKTIGSGGFIALAADNEDNLIAYSFGADGIALKKINTSQGEEIWKQEIKPDGGNFNMSSTKLRYNKKNNCIYLLSSSGIEKFDANGKSAGKALDFASYTLLASGYTVSDMNFDSKGNIYVTTLCFDEQKSNGGGKPAVGKQATNQPAQSRKYEIYKYTLQTGDAQKNQKVIRISARSRDNFLLVAAAKFQKDHPGYKIKIEAPDQSQSEDDRHKYINDLNTQILTGKGPDIIQTNWLPYENYISKNILEDLSSKVNSGIDKSKYYINILNALKTDGKMYMLPLSFTFNMMVANKGILDQESIKIDDSKWTWSDFMPIAQKLTKKDANGNVTRSALPNISGNGLLDDILIYGGNYSNFVDKARKSSKFDSKDFINLLNFVKSCGNSKANSSGIKLDMPAIMEAEGRGSIVFEPDMITNYINYSLSKTSFKGKISLLKLPSDSTARGGMFNSDETFAINGDSKYKDESWDFLKILLSEELQSQMDFPGFSINKAAQQKKAEQAIDMTVNGKVSIAIKGGDSVKPIVPAPLTKADIDYINSFIPRLNTYTSTDDQIMSIIHDETAPFFTGDKSADEAAKLIQKRVDLYLKE